MRQFKVESLLEVVLKTSIGFVLAMLMWIYIIEPIWGWDIPIIENFYITGIFTIKSIAFGYVWRRAHNAGYNRLVIKFIISRLNLFKSYRG